MFAFAAPQASWIMIQFSAHSLAFTLSKHFPSSSLNKHRHRHFVHNIRNYKIKMIYPAKRVNMIYIWYQWTREYFVLQYMQLMRQFLKIEKIAKAAIGMTDNFTLNCSVLLRQILSILRINIVLSLWSYYHWYHWLLLMHELKSQWLTFKWYSSC